MLTGMSLSKFRSKVSDFARPNRFEVLVTPPTSYTFKESDYNLLLWNAYSAQIPSRGIGEVGLKYHGMELKLSGDYVKENITVGFLNSYGWEGRRFFEDWLETCQKVSGDNSRASSISMIDDAVLTITQLGRVEKDTLVEYQFQNILPVNISTIDLSMDQTDQIEKFTVTFSYSHFNRVIGTI